MSLDLAPSSAPQDLEDVHPLVRQSLADSLAWVSLAMGIVGLGYVAVCVMLGGPQALEFRIGTEIGILLSGKGHELGTVATLLTAPLMLWAGHVAKQGRLRQGGFWLSCALFALGLLIVVPRGVHSPGWYLHPLLTILVAVTFGVVPGLMMAIVGALTLLTTAWLQERGMLVVPYLPTNIWSSALPIAAVILATGLLGSIAHKVWTLAVRVEVEHRRRLAETVATLNDRETLLRHVMRGETIGGMASLVAHELRNQMQVISGYTTLGLQGALGTKDEFLQKVALAVRDATRLMQQLMNLAHPGAGTVGLVDLNEICRKFGEDVRRLMPSGIAVEIEISDAPLVARLDPAGLDHALWNLVLNAKQAMDACGTLRIAARDSGAEVRLCVADNGAGIQAEHLPLIFKPYFTTKPKGEGTGLGLAAVDHFVRSAEGRVEVASEPGKGTEFTLVFPLLSRRRPEPEMASA